MGANASRYSASMDASAAVTLRNAADGAETATATETAISLNELRTAWWSNYEIPHGVFEVVFNVSALNTSGDAGYTLSLQVDDTLAQSDSPATIDSFLIVSTGVYKRYVDSKAIPLLNADHSGSGKWLACKVTITGSSGKSITYGCSISKCVGA